MPERTTSISVGARLLSTEWLHMASSMTARAISPIEIRLATPADSRLLAELGAQAFAHTFGPDNTPENLAAYLEGAFTPEIQAAELAEPTSLFLVAQVEGVPVGYARMREGVAPAAIRGAGPIEIARFYARPDWIGRGVGAALMRACLEQAGQRGCATLWLDVWERNHRARAFYARWGFRDVGAQPFQLGADLQTDVLMQRAVPQHDPQDPSPRSPGV